MAQTVDAIVIGAGHNGLVTAALLAKAGFKTLVLEQRPVLGGAAATEAAFASCQVNIGTDDASLLRDEIIDELELTRHGLSFLESKTAVFAPQPDGPALTLWPDVQRSAQAIGQVSARDAARYPAFADQVNRLAGALSGMLLLTPPDLKALKVSDGTTWGRFGLDLRRMGGKEMMEMMRILPLPVSEYLNEWFESEALKGALAAPALLGNQLGPFGSGTTFMFLYWQTNGFLRRRAVAGGMGRLAAALARAAETHGAEIRLDTAVDHILLDGDRATGVTLHDGTQLASRLVISNADPRRTFFDLVGATNLQPRFMRHVRNILYRGVTARMHLLLEGLPRFSDQSEPAQLDGRILISPSLVYLERAYDAAKYGGISPDPMLEITVPTILDPALAPDSRHLMSITMQYAPYRLQETKGAKEQSDNGWAEQREHLGDIILDTLRQYAPDIESHVLDRHILTPWDLEQQVGLTEGSIYHGQMSLDQLLIMRPVPGWSRYATPIENLYLCGAGTHPGGGVTGAPGYNAAREAIKKLRA